MAGYGDDDDCCGGSGLRQRSKTKGTSLRLSAQETKGRTWKKRKIFKGCSHHNCHVTKYKKPSEGDKTRVSPEIDRKSKIDFFSLSQKNKKSVPSVKINCGNASFQYTLLLHCFLTGCKTNNFFCKQNNTCTLF